MEINNTVTTMFTDDIKEDLEMDLMFNVINQVGDKVDQVSGLGDSLTDNIIKGEMKRSSVKENYSLFVNDSDTIDSINKVYTTLEKMQENFYSLIEEGIRCGDFSDLKEYTRLFGKTDKDINYAMYNNLCLENAINKMKEVKEAFTATEDISYSKSLPELQQRIIESKRNTNISSLRIENAIYEMECKLHKRKIAVDQILSEINDDQFAYEVEETNNEEPHNPIVSKVKDPNKEDGDIDDIEGTMEESFINVYLNMALGLDTLNESCSVIAEGAIRQTIRRFLYLPPSAFGFKDGSEKGDYSKVREKLLKRANNSKKIEDIEAFFDDIEMSKDTFEKIIKKMEEAEKATNPTSDQKNTLKYIKNGLTVEKVKEQQKWINTVLKSTLNLKLKELEKKNKGGI